MTFVPPLRRRTVLALLSGAAVMPRGAMAGARPACRVADSMIAIEFDARMRSRIWHNASGAWRALTAFDRSESLHLAGGKLAGPFHFAGHQQESVQDQHGSGTRRQITGRTPDGLEKIITLTLYERYPGFVLQTVTYRNTGTQPLQVLGWGNGAHLLKDGGHGFWSWNGSSHEDRRNWVLPVKSGFNQPNFMGMNASDYGSGTPIVDVWRPDAGLAVGHVELAPKLVSLPLAGTPHGAAIAVDMDEKQTLVPGGQLTTLETFIAVHRGDFFATLDTYRKLMTERGLGSPKVPAASYESVWCAWGYGRDVTADEVKGALPKAAELGLKWAVLDDGWQAAIGDWRVDPKKFPAAADGDMKALVNAMKAAGLRPRLWISPLGAAPGTDLLHDHSDMLLRGRDGEPQIISWWNSFTLCPAYGPTVEYTRQVFAKIIGEWGFEGVKIDGQHLNGVAPCYNPAHHHHSPNESVEGLQTFWKNVYEAVHAANPEAVVEICPCGDTYAYYNFPYMDTAPASDPESSFQVRLKGKSLKALMGPSAAYAGDHVELSDGGDDFASTVGIGAIVSTKFTWPGEGFREGGRSMQLTPEKEAVWRKWIKLYNDRMLPLGRYRGELYDMGFDKPEAHVVEKDDRLYYAFYADDWKGVIELRGLKGRYAVRDYVNDRDLGIVSAAKPHLDVAFRHALLIEAIPTGTSA
jgi:alpha-galactosidase